MIEPHYSQPNDWKSPADMPTAQRCIAITRIDVSLSLRKESKLNVKLATVRYAYRRMFVTRSTVLLRKLNEQGFSLRSKLRIEYAQTSLDSTCSVETGSNPPASPPLKLAPATVTRATTLCCYDDKTQRTLNFRRSTDPTVAIRTSTFD
jgi:hypothetical protein